MTIGILQPGYLPWLGFFDLVSRVDAFVMLDHVQYDKRSWRNRNRILVKGKGIHWLTVPVVQKGRYHQSIADTEVDNSVDWKRKHWRTLLQSYGTYAGFIEHRPFFESAYGRDFRGLCEVNFCFTEYLLRVLSITTPTVRSSDLKCGGRKGQLILDICKELGATHYLSTDRGTTYLDLDQFARSGIRVVSQGYVHPVYEQEGNLFVSHLSVVDLLFRYGTEASGEILSRR